MQRRPGLGGHGVLALVVLVPLAAACSSGSNKAAPPSPTTAVSGAATSSTTSPAAALSTTPVASKGCTAAAVAPGETKVNITSSGVARWYLRHVPKGYDATKPTPLVLDVHGYQEGAGIHAAMSAMGVYGDAKGFITITPNGLGPVPHWDTALGSKDLTFMGDVLDSAEAALCVDTARVYASGLSQGAFMSSSIACALADRVAAVAPVAGITAAIKGCAPARPVPVITFHGTADGFVSYTGGLGEKALDLPTPDGSGKKLRDVPGILDQGRSPSIPEQLAAWAKRNGCTLTLQQRKVTSDVTLLSYPCPKGADVELYRVTGGGHSWPGSVFSSSEIMAKVVGKTTMSINADKLIWAFFEAHPLPHA